MDFSLAAVKAALHRGRTQLREIANEPDDWPHPELSKADRDRLGVYVARFNARDFDAIRAMIADDVRLDLVNKTRLNGKAEVARYFGNYSKAGDWHLVPGLVEGHPAILVFDPGAPGARPKYFVLLNGRRTRSRPSATSVTPPMWSMAPNTGSAFDSAWLRPIVSPHNRYGRGRRAA